MDTSPITARSLQKPYHIKGDEFERAYKDHLSDFRTWKHREHAQKWLVFPKNIGPNLSIDETALSNGDLYTIISNKDAHGRRGTLVAIVSGTRVEDVVDALLRIHWPRADLLQNGLVGSPCSPSDLQESSPTPQFKSINSSALRFLHSPTLTSIHEVMPLP